MSKTQSASPFKGGEPAVHHERAARALERLGILCYDVAKPMKECGCQETVFTNSLVGTKTGGRPVSITLKPSRSDRLLFNTLAKNKSSLYRVEPIIPFAKPVAASRILFKLSRCCFRIVL